jgi:DNA-binding GntR family transcriptional regulator
MQNPLGAAPASPLSLMPKVERAQLHDSVLEHLRNFITEGILPPGTKLNERELCETLGVSRTPLREALKVLAVEGLIDISPNRGASVARMSELEISEAFELISGLEAFAGELACERISEQQLTQIKALHQAMVASKNQHDLPGYYQRNRAIHDLISLAAANSVLRQTYVTTNRRLQALRYLSNQQAPKWQQALRDHEQMLAALEARDGKRLGQILRQHILDKRDAVLAMLRAAEY